MTRTGGVIKTILFLLVVICIGVITVSVTHRDEIRKHIRTHVKVVPQKNSLDLDLGSFSLDNLKGTINMSVYNGLPLGATLARLRYSVFMNGTEICSGLQADSHAAIAPSATSTLKIGFAVDAKKVRSAALKTSPDQMIKLGQTLINQLKGKKPSENSLQGLIRITGNAEIQVFTSSVEIPVEFSRNL